MRPQSPVGRAHDKLGLAFVHFKLGAAARGERVIDVSASTPGYAALLLERGASHLASLDLGPSPLPPKLKTDPRVAFAERADLKNLPRTVLPGPYALFTVDLRFVAARTALRALAFRLSEAANGVVWLKPRFEVGEPLRAGGVSGPAVRAHALALFREKAERLGFAIVSAVDGPGDGDDIEVMLHLSYHGGVSRR